MPAPLRVALVVAALLLASPVLSPAAMWTSVPAGIWDCKSAGNTCVAHTGFRPAANQGGGLGWWGQALNSRGNCTNYAAYRLIKNGAQDPGFRGSGGAGNWASVVRARLGAKRVNGAPAVGSLGWWPAGHRYFPAGHVAYVEKVVGSTVYLSDSSFGLGSSRWRVSKGAARWPSAFLHVNDRPATQAAPPPPPPEEAAPPAPAPAPPPPPPAPSSSVPNQLTGGMSLKGSSNQKLISSDQRYELRMQSDGNLVIYYRKVSPYHPIWATDTVGTGAEHAVMQNDGNFVLYKKTKPIWASGTDGFPGAVLVMQNDGNLVIYQGGKPRWASGTDGDT